MILSSPCGTGSANPSHSQQSASSSVGLGFLHRAGRCRPGGTPFFIPGVLDLQMHGMILSSGDGALSSPGGAGFTNPSHNQQSVIVRGGIDPGDHRFRPGCVGAADRCMYTEWFLIQGWYLIVHGWCWLREPQPSAISHSGVGISTPCGAVWTRGTTVFVPGVLEILDRYYFLFIIITGWFRLNAQNCVPD